MANKREPLSSNEDIYLARECNGMCNYDNCSEPIVNIINNKVLSQFQRAHIYE